MVPVQTQGGLQVRSLAPPTGMSEPSLQVPEEATTTVRKQSVLERTPVMQGIGRLSAVVPVHAVCKAMKGAFDSKSLEAGTQVISTHTWI